MFYPNRSTVAHSLNTVSTDNWVVDMGQPKTVRMIKHLLDGASSYLTGNVNVNETYLHAK